MLVRFDHADQLAPDIKMFWFSPVSEIRNEAGQFIEMFLPHKPFDKRGDKRWFTLSSSPTEELLAITTRLAAENGSTFKDKLFSLQPGDEVDVSGPMGDFVLPKDTGKELLFVAGGIGITPMRSMVKFLSDTKGQRKITLIHAVRTADDLIFKDLFKNYGLKYIPVVSQPGSDWEGESGTLDAKRIADLASGLDGKLVYLSGPEPMTEALAKGLKAEGINKKSLMTDFFPGYTEV